MIHKIYEKYCELWALRDTRLNHMPFIQSPWPMLLLVASYFYAVRMGRKWMEHREPLRIERFIIAYNLIQIIANSIIVLMVLRYIFFLKPDFSFPCEPTDFSTAPISMYSAYISYAYFLLKLFDLLDTVFFILRKKWTHVTFLHVFHHTWMAVSIYIGVVCRTGGHGTLLELINCFVHAVMYSYYLFCIYKPEIRPSITIKKNITRLQLIQHFIVLIHFGFGLFIPLYGCDYPKSLSALGVVGSLSMIILFTNFYQRTYCQKKEQRKIQ